MQLRFHGSRLGCHLFPPISWKGHTPLIHLAGARSRIPGGCIVHLLALGAGLAWTAGGVRGRGAWIARYNPVFGSDEIGHGCILLLVKQEAASLVPRLECLTPGMNAARSPNQPDVQGFRPTGDPPGLGASRVVRLSDRTKSPDEPAPDGTLSPPGPKLERRLLQPFREGRRPDSRHSARRPK